MDGTFLCGQGAKLDPVYPWAPLCSPYFLPMLANQAFWAFLRLKKSWTNLVWLYSIFSVKTNIPISVVERRWSGTLLILLENSCRSWSTTLKSLGKTHMFSLLKLLVVWQKIIKNDQIRVNFLGRLGSNRFQLKWSFGTHCNWKNQNPGGHFEATS